MKNLTERFQYDSQNRLTGITLKRSSGQDLHCGVSYDALGRMTSKQAVTAVNGTPQVSSVFSQPAFDATKVHALASAQSMSDLFPTTAQTVTYTGFDKADKIKQGNDSICYAYGYDHQRIFMEEHIGNNVRTKRYVGNCEYVTETTGNATASRWLTYLTGSTGVYAVVVTANNANTIHYILKDNLGSWTAITSSSGTVEQRLSFDVWGNLRNPNSWSGSFTGTPMFDRGFTGHEHLYAFGLINMNGRLYDPILGRMLSPDVVIQDEQSSQAYNRYSYCFNNPLRFTDPSGYMVRGSSSLFNGFTLFLYESPHNKGVLFNTDEALGQQLPKIEPFGEEEKKAYIAYRNTVFSYNTKEFKTIQTVLIRLENAEEMFRIRMGENTTSKAGGGNFIYNKETGEFDVNIADYGDFSTMGKIAHELKHADQYMDGKIGFDLRGNTVTPFAYDYRDEVEAFERQGLFGNTLTRDDIKRDYYDLWKEGDFKTNKTIHDCAHDNPARPFFLMKKANSDSYKYYKTPIYLFHGWKKDIQ